MADTTDTEKTPAKPEKKDRWRANVDLTLEPPLVPKTRTYEAGAECKDSPDNWPPQWLIDQGLVGPLTEGTDT